MESQTSPCVFLEGRGNKTLIVMFGNLMTLHLIPLSRF